MGKVTVDLVSDKIIQVPNKESLFLCTISHCSLMQTHGRVHVYYGRKLDHAYAGEVGAYRTISFSRTLLRTDS